MKEAGGGQETFDYKKLKEEYKGFQYPEMQIIINGKDLASAKQGLIIYDLVCELSSDFEASIASFYVSEVLDEEKKLYDSSVLKSYLVLGGSAQVLLGYAGKLKEVFCGFVSRVRFIHDDERPMQIEVTLMDVKGIMMSNSCVRQLTAKSYSEAVKEIFASQRYQAIQSNGIFKAQLKVDDTPDKKRSGSGGNGEDSPDTIEMVDESDYDFIVKAAKKFNFEFFIRDGTVIFRKNKSVSTVRIEIGIGKGLKSFDVAYDITGLVTEVEVRGMDDGSGTLVNAVDKRTNKYWGGNSAKSLLSGSKKVYFDPTVHDKSEAKNRAESLMDEISNRFGRLECECDGLPELIPGYNVKLVNLGDKAENTFYITNVRHVMSDTEGYKTYLSGEASSVN
ncbi:MAG: phage late control D family protein [Lachnospiraceae bacterium]|nr:phage late control D family protein [Lachnospiraceae bacterium]